MKKTTAVSVIALSLALVGGNIAPQLGLGVVPAAAQSAQDQYAAPERNQERKGGMNPKIGKPLNDAQQLYQQKKYEEALAKVKEAELVEKKTPNEVLATSQIGYNIYVALQDWAGAGQALEGMISSGLMSPADTAKFTKLIVPIYLQAKDYAKTVEWGQKNKDDPESQIYTGQAYVSQENFPAASEALSQGMKMAAAKGVTPKEEWLQLQLNVDYQLKNVPGVQAALEQLVQRYPKPSYWQDLLSVMEKSLRGGSNSAKSSLDVYRLMLAAGTMRDAAEYMEMGTIAFEQKLPGEAKTLLEKGMAAGILGQGADKAAQQRFLTRAATESAADLKGLDAGVAEAAKQKTGDADVQFGEAYWSYGQFDKAIELIQRGIGKGVKNKDDAHLRLGLAYIGAGQRPQALEAFQQITPNTPTAHLSRLWTYLSANKSPT